MIKSKRLLAGAVLAVIFATSVVAEVNPNFVIVLADDVSW